MERSADSRQIEEGNAVVGSDGEKVGKVIGANAGYIVVEKGLFFPTDYYIPRTAIASRDGTTVTLTVSKDEALAQGWDVIPGDETVGTPGGAFLTGATSYDEQVGVGASGDSITDADLRLGTEYASDDVEIAERIEDEEANFDPKRSS